MTIEIMYPEIANLFGDLYNIKYLEKCIPKAKVIYTNLNDEPYFTSKKVDLIYMGSMTEGNQEIVIEKLKPYKTKINELINNGTVFLITGNALEVFGKSIDDIKGLGIFNFHTKRDFSHHHTSHFIGEFDDHNIVGFKSQFSHSYDNQNNFIKVIHGCGFNKEDEFEGVHKNNFIATYLIGPLLIMNPYFTKYILKILKQDDKLLYESDMLKSYEIRVKEFLDKRMKY